MEPPRQLIECMKRCSISSGYASPRESKLWIVRGVVNKTSRFPASSSFDSRVGYLHAMTSNATSMQTSHLEGKGREGGGGGGGGGGV